MTTYQHTYLSNPKDGEKIPVGTLNYMRTRNKRRLYSLIIREFKKSGISQTELATRLGKRKEQISRWLAGPGNWQNDTASDLLFAINGGEASYGISYPLAKSPRNDVTPYWLLTDGSGSSQETPYEVVQTRSANTATHTLEPA